MKVHLLIDLSGLSTDPERIPDLLKRLQVKDGLGDAIEAANVLLPINLPSQQLPTADGWALIASQRPVLEAASTIRCAGDLGRHLLVLIGETFIANETLGVLLESFEIDPHFGVALPRQIDSSTGGMRKLSNESGDPEFTSLPRRVVTAIPEYYIIPELLSACMLIRDCLISNLPELDENSETLAGAFQLYLSRIRRTGFRTVIVNRAAIPKWADRSDKELLPSKSDTLRLHTKYADAGMAKTAFVKDTIHVYESLLGRLFSPDITLRKSLLLDIRGLRNHTNGTAEAIFSLCDALVEINTDWTISLLGNPASIESHDLAARYSSWPILDGERNQFFTVAVRLSQPWHFEDVIGLHRMALLNFFCMLDTIAWDILFESSAELGDLWEFMSEHSDGLLYNSFDTRDHFSKRFGRSDSKRDYVVHHSFHPGDYASEADVSNPGAYIFLVGSNYDHKHLYPTVDLLSRAFPLLTLKVLGLKEHPNPKVEAIESGRYPASEIDQLFRGAKIVVFPSFYEGFGFPVLKGLSYGRVVIARRTPLLKEIASHYRGPGKLVDFTSPVELVEAVGGVIHSLPLEELTLGSALSPGEEPRTWRDIARGFLAFLERRMADPSTLRWRGRERAIRQMNAFALSIR